MVTKTPFTRFFYRTANSYQMRKIITCIIFAFMSAGVFAQHLQGHRDYNYSSREWKQIARSYPDEFFKTPEARRIAQNVLDYQRITGGWPKNLPIHRELGQERDVVLADKGKRNDSTTDNDATITEMTYLARLYNVLASENNPADRADMNKYKEAFLKGLQFMLSGQYKNGGWPQFWPDNHGYQIHITYNDDAMVQTMQVIRDLRDGKAPFGNLVDAKMRKKLAAAFDKGVECILNTQIVVNGKPTVWCQQHDRETLKPAPARSFELASYCSSESASLVKLLMEIPNPSNRIKEAVNGAMEWFESHKLMGIRLESYRDKNGQNDRRVVNDSKAGPIWARYYDLENEQPFFCDRDGVPKKHLSEIGHERRNGYGWYSDGPARLYRLYNRWKAKYNKSDAGHYDAIVKNGESIQAAIEKAPVNAASPYVILVKKGTYNEKVIIDKPNIVLLGEDRNETKIVFPELSSKRTIKEYKGKPVGNGVIVLQEGANDCIISNLTVYNNYGSTIEPTTAHQMAIFGRATRTIVINCNVWADGNDALSLWAEGGEGMYYHADLFLRCPGVDFLCPRGWCYATRCRFYGDGRALIWHDGRGNYDKKLVITDSHFDSKSPVTLGRYHHDSQFFLINCTMSDKIIDHPIGYAYTDQVLDPCPWGQRVYIYNVHRKGGDFNWMRNNLDEAKGAPRPEQITPKWTFDGKWDPEARIDSLWDVLAYNHK